MTLRTWRRLALIGLTVTVLQIGIFQRITFGGAHPDAFLLMAIAAGLVAGAQQGAVVGFCAGLLADLFVVTPFGLSALCYVIVAFTVGLVASIPPGRTPVIFRVTVTFVASIAGALLYAGLLDLIGTAPLPRAELVDVVLMVSVANAIFAIPATAALSWAFSGAGAAGRELATSGGSALR